jgi:hypothetical protein
MQQQLTWKVSRRVSLRQFARFVLIDYSVFGIAEPGGTVSSTLVWRKMA